jgi:hypothetical protein
MSTVRIQVRRGTASEWTTANPILAAGEMGVETNTNKFKFGNGSSTWTALSYAAADTAAIGEISQDAINTALSMGAGLTKTYDDGANTITITVDTDVISTKAFATSAAGAAQTAAEATAAADASTKASAAQTAAIAAAALDASAKASATLTAATTAAEAYTDTAISGVNNSLGDYIEVADRGVMNGVASLDANAKVPQAQLPLNVLTTNINTSGTVSAGTVTADNVTSADTLTANNVNISGNLTVTGTTTTVSSTNVSYEDPLIYMGDGNQSNVLDLGIVTAFNDGTYQHAGLVRDASDNGIWKLFAGVTTEPGATVDFTNYTKEDLEIGHLYSDSARIGSVTNIEIQHLGGVTSPIQAQLNSKLESVPDDSVGTAKLQADSVTTAKIADAAIDTVKIGDSAVSTAKIADGAILTAKLADGSVTSAKIPNNTISQSHLNDDSVGTNEIGGLAVTTAKIADAAVTTDKIANAAVTTLKIEDLAITNEKIATTAGIAQSKISGLTEALDAKATIDSPTFTGEVVLPATTSIGLVDATEMGYLNGVTSSIQTQLTALGAADLAHEADTTNIHGIADTSLLATTANVATAKSEAITAAGSAADTKVADAVAALTKSSVGLANVDNTSDANKPVSAATQTALDLKAPKSTPTFTGTVTASNDLVVDGNLTVNGTTFNASSTSITIEDNMVQLAHQNAANSVDLGLVVGYNDGSAKHAGLVRDVSDAKWKLFKGVTTEPSTTVDFTQGSLDDLKVAAFEATTVTPSSGVVFSDGTQTKAGVPSLTTIGTVIAGAYNLSTGGLALRDQLIPVSGAHAITVPTNATTAYPVGTSISFYQSAGTDANFVEASGVTILRTPGLKLRTTSSSATITKVATDTWLLAGDLKA